MIIFHAVCHLIFSLKFLSVILKLILKMKKKRMTIFLLGMKLKNLLPPELSELKPRFSLDLTLYPLAQSLQIFVVPITKLEKTK